MRSNILGNLLNIVSFHMFGDNYYGLRMPMVLIGFLNLSVLGIVLLELRKQYGKRTSAEMWGIIGILMLMSHHFYFYLSSRTVEPSTLRMFFAQLTMLIWLKSKKKGKLCFFLMGICITVSVFLVYVTNVFLYLAAGLLLLLIWKNDGFKQFFQNTCAFVAGTLILFVVAEVYYYVVWDTFAVANLLASIGVFSGVSGYEITSGGILSILWGMLRGAIRYFSSNFFLYSPALLTAILLIFPVAVWSVIREKDKDIFFLVAIPVSFLLQTMVSEDYIWRKFLVVCPFVMYLTYWGVLNREKIGCLINGYKEWCGNITEKNRRIGELIIPGYIILSALASVCVAFYRFNIIEGLGERDFASIDKLLVLVLGCLPILIWAAFAIITLIKNKAFSANKSVLLLGGTSLLLGLSLLFVHVWHNPTFEERDSMISLSEEHDLDGKYVIGDFVIGITLYNDLKPVMQPHTSYSARMIDNPELILHHYDNLPEYLDTEIFGPISMYTADKIASVPGTLQINGETRNFALYKASLRGEVFRREKEHYETRILQLLEEFKALEQNNSGMSAFEVIYQKDRILGELAGVYADYEDSYEDRKETVVSPIYVDTYGDIRGDICAPVYGRIYGDIYGDVKAVIYGELYGDIYGDVYVPLEGTHYGEVYGRDFN